MPRRSPTDAELHEEDEDAEASFAPPPREFAIDARSGHVRQAGAAPSSQQQPWLQDFVQNAERFLYVFAKSVLGLTLLTKSLHLPLTLWLQKCPPYRKLYMLPRDCLKTSIARALTIHILIQRKETNCYLKGKHGPDTRILYAGEIIDNAIAQLSWIQGQYESNKRLRAFWPHLMWDNPRVEAKQWSSKGLVVKRETDYPEPSIRPIGVGGAIAGYHGDVQIKDDLVTLPARLSLPLMQTAKEWHTASRPLFDDPDTGLEFILGTHWTTDDLYVEIKKDPSVEVVTRAAIENGHPIFPERLPLPVLEQLKQELNKVPGLFSLLYMNNAYASDITDFQREDFRFFHLRGTQIITPEDSRDILLQQRQTSTPVDNSTSDADRGKPLSQVLRDHYDPHNERKNYLKFNLNG